MSTIDYDKPTDALLLSMALPLIGKLLIAELYGVVDTFFIGRFLGGGALSALGLVFPMQRFLFSLPILVGVGTSTLLSRSLGKGKNEEAGRIIGSGALLIMVLQLFFALISFSNATGIMAFFGAKGTSLVASSDYLSYASLGSIFFALNSFLSFVLLSLGNTKISVISMVLGALLNILLDPIFIGPLGFGIEGAAIASMISQFLGALYALVAFRLFIKNKEIKLFYKPRISYFIPLFIGGLAAFIIEIEDSLVISVLNSLLLSKGGEEGVMILSVVTKLTMFLFITLFGIASAMQPLAAYLYGAKNKVKLRELLRKTFFYSFSFTLCIWIVFMLRAESLVGLFIKDAIAIKKTAGVLRIVMALFPFTALYYLDIFNAQAKGDSTRALLSSLLRQIFLLIPISLLLVKGFGLGTTGVWLSFPLTDGVASFIAYLSLSKQGLIRVFLPGKTIWKKQFKKSYSLLKNYML
ncbi:MAG: MATE family efflux transporter [Tissierellia bacterium]|nr:MATE family efflux transporter [Tissierellia bacterium]